MSVFRGVYRGASHKIFVTKQLPIKIVRSQRGMLRFQMKRVCTHLRRAVPLVRQVHIDLHQDQRRPRQPGVRGDDGGRVGRSTEETALLLWFYQDRFMYDQYLVTYALCLHSKDTSCVVSAMRWVYEAPIM